MIDENLIHEVERRAMALLSEVEGLRQQLFRKDQEINALRQKEDENTQRLRGLVALLDSVNPVDQVPAAAPAYANVTPMVAQV
jgi:hypothetical protein